MKRLDASYAPFWCEENVWQLARRADTERWDDAQAVFISSAERCVAMFDQRAAPEGQPIVWDYHVVLWFRRDERWWVIDLDNRSGQMLPLEEWLDASFPVPELIPDELQPTFRVIDARAFLDDFRTDRSHMIDEDGNYRAEPPDWEPLHEDSNLWSFVSPEGDAPGVVLHLENVRDRYV